MEDISIFWPPLSSLIHGATEHEHLAITRFKTNIEDAHRTLDMIK